METLPRDQERINEAMYRCDRALGKLIGKGRKQKQDVNELVGACLNLLNEIRVVENSKRFGLNGYLHQEPVG